ncbi:50S ribosomal protein L19e [bacterium]|nr:50S ribosomal protein L19e [bacterium]
MNLRKQKQLAARTLGISKKRVKLVITDSASKKELKDTISREGVKELVGEKLILKLPKKGISRTRANHIASQKKKGRRQGQGSRKGTANARENSKDIWIEKIRALRNQLRKLKESGYLNVKDYRMLYRKAKGNFFRNKRHMMLYINQNNLLQVVEKNEELKN